MTDRVHTCHAECSCHTGGEPTPDFLPVEGVVPRIGWYAYLLDLADTAEARRAAAPRKLHVRERSQEEN